MDPTPASQAPAKAPDEAFCASCGAVIKAAAEICPKCGVRTRRVPLGTKSKIAAGILAIFLGDFGVHKFFLGQPGLGILYLVFFWTFIPGLVGIVEGIIYLTTSDEAFAAKYG